LAIETGGPILALRETCLPHFLRLDCSLSGEFTDIDKNTE
jgi:hypothetical protein